MKVIVFGITGLARSGKNTAARFLVKKFGFLHFDFYRDVIVELLKKKGLKATKLNASKLGNELRKRYGKGIMGKLLAKKILKEIKKFKRKKIVIVITGIRSKEEIKEFEKILKSKIILIEIYAPEKERFKRSKLKSFKEFKEREKLDKEKGLGEVLKLAKFRIKNILRKEMKKELKLIVDKFV